MLIKKNQRGEGFSGRSPKTHIYQTRRPRERQYKALSSQAQVPTYRDKACACVEHARSARLRPRLGRAANMRAYSCRYLRGLVSCCQQLTRKEYADGDRAEKGGGVVTIVP